MVRALAVFSVALVGCSFLTKDDGQQMQKQIDDMRSQAQKHEEAQRELGKQLDAELKRMKQVVDDATKVITRNSADVGLTVQNLQQALAQLTGRIDDIQHTEDAISKQFQDYRASSDTKLEQLNNTVNVSKNPPVPETPDALYSEGEKRIAAQQWAEARRLYEAFVNRYPQDPRAARAQYNIGEAYFGEKRYANAIGAYTKVNDNFSKSDVVPDAMYKNGLAFHALKYCSDAKVYFQELLKRYPKTQWKKDAADELKKLVRDAKNRAVCST